MKQNSENTAQQRVEASLMPVDLASVALRSDQNVFQHPGGAAQKQREQRFESRFQTSNTPSCSLTAFTKR